jgi:pimeloyl-ACP methyl ester carboxylesterase
MNVITRSFVSLDGVQLAYVVFGSGVPVIALHGWGASIDLIAPLAQPLAKLGYSVHVLDLPGFGESPAPKTAWGVSDYTNLVMGYLAHQQIERAHFFGHSFGGRVSIMLAAQHPQRVDKLVLADSAGVLPRRSATMQLRLQTYKIIRDGLYSIGMNTLADRLRTWYNERYGSTDLKQSGVLRDTFLKVVNEDLLPYAARIQASTLLVWGSTDEDTPLWQGKLLESTIPDAGMVLYEGAGHYSYLERLDDTVKTIDYFFKH